MILMMINYLLFVTVGDHSKMYLTIKMYVNINMYFKHMN